VREHALDSSNSENGSFGLGLGGGGFLECGNGTSFFIQMWNVPDLLKEYLLLNNSFAHQNQ
jgi:hypothetical protein